MRRLPPRHLKRKPERRIVLARVVVVPGELRDAEVVRARLLALVDAGVEIDEVPAGLAGCLHDHLDVALAVEAASVADIGVVVDHMHDVGSLGPARALQVNAKLGAGWPAPDVERQRGGFDPERAGLLAFAADIDPQAMGAAEIVRHREGELDVAALIRARLRHLVRTLLPAAAADPVADHARPVERVALARLEALAAHRD